ncbi:MAG: autotransporter outer membrane beta-barrel domain-containing protein, partial [Desulfovibrio sp.]|nr:autotransporter outer membrane beta-barrel domain-containing protein [Desulfovibrio sp.]
SALTPAGQPSSILEYLTGNAFTGVETTVTGDIAGGGVAGAHSGYSNDAARPGVAGSLNISGNRFSGVSVSSRHLSGGGVIGFDAAGTSTHGASAYIDSLSDNIFDSPTVTTGGFISGGGVLGVRSESGISWIGSIVRNIFQGAKITAGSYIDGGGLIGATGEMTGAATQLIGIGEISGSRFSGNTVTANDGQIMGGAVYSYGLAVPMTISDSVFTDNTFTSLIDNTHNYSAAVSPQVYGTVTVDTGLDNPGNLPHTLTLTATDGNSTIFSNNRIVEGNSSRYNSLYFGTVKGFTTNSTDPSQIDVKADPARADAALIVAPEAGGVVALYDPIEVNQDSGKTFNMYVRGAGEFLWGGANNFVLDTANGVVNFESGSTTTLLSGMSLDAESHDLSLDSGGRINVMGSNRLNVNDAVFNGRLHFNLMGTTLNDPSTVLLTIESPNLAPNADVGGATVSLSDFAAGPTLRDGDEFYLMATDGDNYLAGDPANDRASARQGLTRQYSFIIDKNQTKTPGASRYLVARLAGVKAAPQTRILSEGRAASLAVLAQRSGWLADHSFQQADLALRQDGCAAFGGIDGSYFYVDSGSDLNIRSTHFLAGIAARNSAAAGSLLLGGFLEAGFADYDVDGDFTPSSEVPDISGGGTVRFYGAGLMGRQTWRNLRLEGSLRAGRVENRFDAGDYRSASGESASYETDTPYFAAHAGLGYEWKISDASSLDFLARYYWTRQNGASEDLPTGERVHFKADQSHRARAGLRYTHASSDLLSFYGGAAYEYEFDGKTRASAHGLNFDTPDMGGATGIGEIGAIVRSRANPHRTAELGLQTYVGRIRGVSAGIRLGWEF